MTAQIISNVSPISKKRMQKKDTYESANILYEVRKLALNAFKSRIILLKPTQGKASFFDLARVGKVSNCTWLKILTSKPMLRRLPVALGQLKTGNTSENLLNKIGQIIIQKLLKEYIITWWSLSSYNTKWTLYLWILKIWIS